MQRTTENMRLVGAALALLMSIPLGARTPVTYHRDVLPILEKNCNGCHSPGRLAPMSFTTYEETRPWAAAIRVVVASKKMPPQIAAPHQGLFGDDGSLRPLEVETIVRWVEGGALEGSARDARKGGAR